MKKLFLVTLANSIFLIHCCVVAFVAFGGFFPLLWKWHLAIAATALILDGILGYCFLSKWEFLLRKKVDSKTNYDYSFSSYYLQKLFKHAITETFVEWTFVTFLIFSIVIDIVFHIILK